MLDASPRRSSDDAAGDGDGLQALLARDGYLLLEGLLDPADVRRVAAEMLHRFARHGWFRSGTDPLDARMCAPYPTSGSERHDAPVGAVYSSESFHELAFHPRILAVMASLLDARDVAVHTKAVRAMVPDAQTVAHQDFPATRGATDTLTAWLPLVDCPRELGGLEVVAGSHRDGLRRDVDDSGALREPPHAWRAGEYRVGDVVVMHSLTVHRSGRNDSDRLRLSVDYRYTSTSEYVCESRLRDAERFAAAARRWSTSRWVTLPAGMRTVPRAGTGHDRHALREGLELSASRFLEVERSVDERFADERFADERFADERFADQRSAVEPDR
jgi:hypothetical protein